MPHNSCKSRPISIIFSVSHCQMNCRKTCIRFTTSPQICRCTNLRNLNIQLCNFTVHYSMQLWCTIVYLQYLSIRDAKFYFLCLQLCRLICNHTTCVKIVCPQHTCMLWGMHASDATSQWMHQRRVVKRYSALRHARQWRHQSMDATETRC